MTYVWVFLAGAVAGAFVFYYVGKSALAAKIEGELQKVGVEHMSVVSAIRQAIGKKLW